MAINPFETVKETIDLSPKVADRIETSTCYMCACRCGIRVYFKDKKIRFIEGNPDHPTNRGVLCAKGSADISLMITGLVLAFGSVGVLIERWLFFAEAKHVVTLYYGTKAV